MTPSSSWRWMFIGGTAALLWLNGCSHPDIQRRHHGNVDNLSVPDQQTRKWAMSVQSEDIAYLRFSGPQMGCDSDSCINVADTKGIDSFLTALRHADGRRGMIRGNRVSSLEVVFKPQPKGVKALVHLSFSPYDPLDCFGQEFQRALKVLGDSQAQQTQQKVRDIAPRVRVIRIGSRQYRDPKTVQQVLAALQQVDGRAFDYTNPAAEESLVFDLTSKEGSSTELSFILDPYAGSSTPPLPQPLWSLYSRLLPLKRVK